MAAIEGQKKKKQQIKITSEYFLMGFKTYDILHIRKQQEPISAYLQGNFG